MAPAALGQPMGSAFMRLPYSCPAPRAPFLSLMCALHGGPVLAGGGNLAFLFWM